MTPLDARYLFHIQPQLNEADKDVAREIPGMIVRTTGRVSATALDVPYAAGWIVDKLLQDGAIGHTRTDPVLVTTASADGISKAVMASNLSEAHDWLWYDPKKDPPTVAEPIRLLPYQRKVIEDCFARGGGHVWAPPGSGKTVIAHTWALAVTRGPIVVVTRSDARETHRRELIRCSTAIPFVWKPQTSVRKRDTWPNVWQYLVACFQAGKRPIVIVGWGMLSKVVDCVIADVAPAAVIFDESHRAKSRKRYKWTIDNRGELQAKELDTVSMAAFRLACATPYRMATTATAIRHRTWDLWGQLTLVEPYAWGKTVTRFARRYCDAKPGDFGGLVMSGRSNVSELKGRLSFVVSKVDYSIVQAQMHGKRRQIVRIPLESQIQALPRSKEDAAAVRVLKGEAARGSGLARHRLQEARLGDAASRKRRTTIGLVKQYMATGKGKILVMTGRRRDCEDLGEKIGRIKGLTSWWAHGDGWGGTEGIVASGSADARMDIQDAYMGHPGPCAIVGTIDAWGESRNLQDTDVLLCVQLPYTPGKVDQLEGRVQRLGMDRPVLVVYMVAEETIDERVAALLIDKLPAVQDITGGGALDGLEVALKGLDDPEAVEASFSTMFDDLDLDLDLGAPNERD